MLSPLQKACLQSKTADELNQAYSADDFLNEGIGAAGSIGIGTPLSHSFYPYVDGKIIKQEPLSRGIQVPGVFGYSMIYPYSQTEPHKQTN